jgi:SAM-dependent methyltransferase
MKRTLQNLLVCTSCHSALELEILRADADEVMDGFLRCGCGLEYPVIEGVPRMLPADLLPALKDDYPEFFSSYARGTRPIDSAPTAATAIRRRTQEAFGYEWTWAADYHADNFRDWLPEGFDPEAGFRGKLGLEVGCGAGRHAAATAGLAAEHVAVDLSRAVDSAFARTRGLLNCHVVQADVMHLPFRERSFDYVYCLGVLQHTADPEASFHALARQPKPGGLLVVNIYQASRPVMLFLLECFRQITTRLSPGLVKDLSVAAGIVEYGLFIGPWKRIRATHAGRLLRPIIPDRLDDYAKDDFDTCVTDWFDRLACPVKKHYRREDLMAWFAHDGYVDVTVTAYWKAFWNGCGRRPVAGSVSIGIERTPSLAVSHLAAGER